MRRWLPYICILFALFATPASAQKVGVVLSGGGAKGLYHIGILKALEENEIPIDYITGTSMGAIVGGLYASGYSPDQILGIFASDDVPQWVSGKIEERYYYQKQEPNSSLLSFNINTKGLESRKSKVNKTKLNFDEIKESLKSSKNGNFTNDEDSGNETKMSDDKLSNSLLSMLVPSLIPSVQLDLAILNLFTPSTALAQGDFDRLFIPFRCIASDLTTREQYLWKEGDLGEAIRSSMAIPFVFKPLVYEDKLLYDGGVLNNYPLREMQEEFNPDFIIGGVCLSGKPDPATIAGQVEILTTSKSDYNIPDSVGVQIKRDVDVGVLDYSKALEISKLGYDDTIAFIDSLKTRINRRESVVDVETNRREYNDKLPKFKVEDVEITGLNIKQQEYIDNHFDFTINKTFDYESFREECLEVVSTGLIEMSLPTATYNPHSGGYKVKMNMVAKPSFKAMVGLNISSASINTGYVGFQYTKLGVISSIYTLDGYLGSFYSSGELSARYNFYGGKTPYYFDNLFNYTYLNYGKGNSQASSYNDISSNYSRLSSCYLSTCFGMPITRSLKFEMRASMGEDINKYVLLTNQDIAAPNNNRTRYISFNGSFRSSTLNFRTFPTRGFSQTISAFTVQQKCRFIPQYNIDQSGVVEQNSKDFWFGVSFKQRAYIPIVGHFTMGYLLEGIYTTMPNFATDYITTLSSPGFKPIEHSETIVIPEFYDKSFAAVGLEPIFEWNNNIYLKGGGYLYIPNLESFKDVKDRLRYIASASLVYQSPFGPVSLSYSHYDTDLVSRDFVTLNIGLLLFKKRGIQFF